MLSNILHNALGGTVRGTAAWGKPGTTNVCVLTLTSWILCPPGKNVDVFTFRQSCAAPACCSMLRTSVLVQVSHKYSVLLFNCYCMIFQMLTYLSFAIIFYYILLKSRCQWVLYPNVSADEPTAWGYLCDLLSALEHLHSRGFVHLDLKPANVLVTSSGRLKLGDFGLLLELKHTTGDAVEENVKDDMQEGDPRYMAPELLRGEYGPAADVFRYGSKLTKYLKCAPSKLHSNWHINGFLLVWALLFWNLLVTSRFLMVERAGSSSDRAASHQSLPAVRSTSCSFFIHFCLLFFFFFFKLSFYVCRPVRWASVSATDDAEPKSIWEADSFWASQPPFCLEIQMEKTNLPLSYRGCTDPGLHLPGTQLHRKYFSSVFRFLHVISSGPSNVQIWSANWWNVCVCFFLPLQLVACFGYRLFSFLHSSFLPRWTKADPCTLPRDSVDRDVPLSLSALHAESANADNNAVFLSDPIDPEFSPTFLHR